MTFVQRFGGSLNLNVHFHVVVLDGVYTRSHENAAPVFHPNPAPGRATLVALATRVRDRRRACSRGRSGARSRRSTHATAPLVRFHGVLAPNAPWRSAIVPAPERAAGVRCGRAHRAGAHAAGSMRAPGPSSDDVPRAEARSELPAAAVARRVPRATTTPPRASPVGTRLDWASLLRRVFDLDVLYPFGEARRDFVDGV